MAAGVHGEHGQHVQKPVELDLKAGKELVLVTTLDMTNVLDHMRRRVTVTLKCAPVSHVSSNGGRFESGTTSCKRHEMSSKKLCGEGWVRVRILT